MKYLITIFSAALILSSCNKKAEEPKRQVADTTNNPAAAVKNYVDNLDKDAMKTHKRAFDALVNLPGGGPIPPNLLPVKDVKLLRETDSTASYSFISGSEGIKVEVGMKRRITAEDTVWMVSGIEEFR